jgi:hypothetical protein
VTRSSAWPLPEDFEAWYLSAPPRDESSNSCAEVFQWSAEHSNAMYLCDFPRAS